MRFTLEHRIMALEREVVVLQDSMKMLHNMLKEQKKLIHDYITHGMAGQSQSLGTDGNSRPEDAMYTFVCGKRMQRIEKELDKIRQRVNGVNNHERALKGY